MGSSKRSAVRVWVLALLLVSASLTALLDVPAAAALAQPHATEGNTAPQPCPAYDTNPALWCLHSTVVDSTDVGPSAGTYVLHLSRSGDSSVSISVPGRTLQGGTVDDESNTSLQQRDTATNTRTSTGEAILDRQACPQRTPSCTISFHHENYPYIAPGGDAPPSAWLFVMLPYEDPGDASQYGGTAEAAIQIVFDDAGAPSTKPVAAFTAAADAPGSRLWHFDASTSSSTGSVSYAWTFGDGSTGTGAIPSHTYGADGDDDVTLTVTDSGGTSDPVTHTVHVGAAALVVNSAGDQPENASALSRNVCDIRESSPVGDETCTLRAALALANQRQAAQAISFAIPGAGTPTISPVTALPLASTPVSIDGTTQPGGWVVLSGAATSGPVDGIEVDGAASTVRGLVVNGFSQGAGIVAGGVDGGQVITGNRVGTNLAGLGSVPNQLGILATSPGVTIGGTAGTAALACAGDCNLVGGNAVAQISNTIRVADPSPVAGRVDLTVIGDWVGVDATGGAAIPAPEDNYGVFAIIGGSTPDHLGDHVLVGGPSTVAGRAPGNLIYAAARGVTVIDKGTVQDVPTGRATVAGNLIGEDATGGRALGKGTVGVYVAGDAGSTVVGGLAPGAGNVVGGWNLGIYAYGLSSVAGNRVGTDVTGTSAVPNDIGVRAGVLTNNLISGNSLGVQAGVARLYFGNLVGLDATGTRALPNNVGIGPAAGQEEPEALRIGVDHFAAGPVCSVDPCNVISGNTTTGIEVTGSDPQVEMAGTYVGTDVSGTRSVPNGAGLRASTGSLRDVSVGGPSGAASARGCTYPCNVIAGNTGSGLLFDVGPAAETHQESGSVAGNYIGVGADGNALPNLGRQLDIAGPPDGDALTIGGDIERGNFIATGFSAGSPPALFVGGSGATYPRVTAIGNRFDVPGPGSAITRPGGSVNPPILSSVTVAGSGVTISGSTNVAADLTLPPEQIELYAVSSCDAPGTYAPIATGTATILSGDFSITIAPRALAGTTGIYAVRTDQAHSTSRFSPCLTGPTVTTATRPFARGARELDVASNAGWGPGSYAQVDTTAGPVVRRVAALGSLIFAAPLPADVESGAAVVRVAPPLGDVTAPEVKVKAPPHHATRHGTAIRVRVRPRAEVRRGSRLVVRLRCTDTHGVGVEHCPSKLRLSTRRSGRHHRTIEVSDRNGNARTVRFTWRVARSGHHAWGGTSSVVYRSRAL